MKSQPFGPYIINLYLPSGLSILIKWASPFPVLGVTGILFHFYLILIEIPVNQTPRSASAKVAEKGRQAYMG